MIEQDMAQFLLLRSITLILRIEFLYNFSPTLAKQNEYATVKLASRSIE